MSKINFFSEKSFLSNFWWFINFFLKNIFFSYKSNCLPKINFLSKKYLSLKKYCLYSKIKFFRHPLKKRRHWTKHLVFVEYIGQNYHQIMKPKEIDSPTKLALRHSRMSFWAIIGKPFRNLKFSKKGDFFLNFLKKYIFWSKF